MKIKRKKSRSMRSSFMLLLGFSAGVCMALLFVYSVYAMQVARKQAAELNRNTIVLQCSTVDTMLAYGNQYLVFLSAMTDDIEIVGENDTASTEYHLAGWRILQQFQKGHQQYGSIDGTFLYFPELGTYLTSSDSNISYDCRHAAQRQITRYLQKETPGSSCYFTVKLQEGYIIVKILPVTDGYIGLWYTTETLLSALQTSEISQIDYIVLATRDNLVLNGDPIFARPLNSESRGGEEYVTLEGKSYLVSRSTLQSEDFLLLALADEARILEKYRVFYIIFFLLLLFLDLTVVVISLVCRSILSPLKDLVDVMNRVRRGDWEAQFEEKRPYEEFQLFFDTFNLMVQEIKRLKMDIYEEKLQRQRIKRQYYQIQIQPHFFMNSINMIYQLAQAGNYELVEQMALHLSGYFRYSLKNKEERICLREELSFIGEYLEIQKIRYPYHLKVRIRAEPHAAELKLPPLTVQTFVENAIKYSINMDTVTEIELSAVREQRDGEHFLKISVSDNGPGFPEQVLAALREGRQVVGSGRKCLGIYNVQQRLQLIYGKKSRLTFQNRAPHGAQVEIWMPADADREESLEQSIDRG